MLFVFALISNTKVNSQIFVTTKASIAFTSDAPLELIKAESSELSGLLDINSRSFAFKVPMSSFKGFNSPLQQTHFNENYMETSKYPNTIFEGKIIEEVDLKANGTYNVRGKGKFTSHGVVQERIIKCKVVVSSGKIRITSDFTVLLNDHNIKIPTVVSQKIAEEIQVHTEIELISKK